MYSNVSRLSSKVPFFSFAMGYMRGINMDRSACVAFCNRPGGTWWLSTLRDQTLSSTRSCRISWGVYSCRVHHG
ncbi:hypothetical protein VTJ83DRAFT_5010 [Remersonia thermophila]|uniref:Uncharacterized protein n=1 Tax=Remersonia thermophila TaxID=72144 RepID=A0ABR4DBM1_9PEZI